jgi:hypothetical protein
VLDYYLLGKLPEGEIVAPPKDASVPDAQDLEDQSD